MATSPLNLEMIHRTFFYLKIALIPVFAVIGYMFITRGWNWLMPDHNAWLASRGLPLVNPVMAVFTTVIMTFVSIFYCIAIRYSTPPSSFMFYFTGFIQLVLIIFATKYLLPAGHADAQNEFWRWILNALVIENNAILISTLIMKLYNPSFTISGSSDPNENNILFGYLFVSMALFNVTSYGLFFWRSFSAADLTNRIILIGITLAAGISYFFAYRAPVEKLDSAKATLPAFLIAIPLASTWTMLLLVYPLAGFITYMVKNWPK